MHSSKPFGDGNSVATYDRKNAIPFEDEHVPSMIEVEASCQLEHNRTKSTDWPFNYLATGTRDSVKLQVQVASQLYFEKPDFSHSILTPV